MTGIHSRAMAAVNLVSLQDKELASDQIRLESNLMMMKLGEALKKKYLTRDGMQGYGLKDEGNTIQSIRDNISNSLDVYKLANTKPVQPKGS